VFAHTCQDYFDTCFSFPFVCPTLPFDFVVSPYVEHDIGNTSNGTFFGVNGPGSVSSKIVALATPNGTCGTWSINLQGQHQIPAHKRERGGVAEIRRRWASG
jgi:hypothetical protein